jgi:PAS domain S-box-containing protein
MLGTGSPGPTAYVILLCAGRYSINELASAPAEDRTPMSGFARRHILRWFARPLILEIAAVLTLSIATGFLGLQNWRDRQAVNLSLEHGRQVIDRLDRLRTIIVDLEAERHGYLLTLDPTYLKAYGVSDESVRREAAALRALVADDPLQSFRVGHLALIVSAKLREIDDIVKTAARLSGQAAQAMIRGMDDIRLQIDLLQDVERLQLVVGEKRAGELEQRRMLLTIAAGVIVVVLAGTALARARREAKRRRKATEENVQLQSGLQERDRKIRRLVDSNIIGVMIWDLPGRILEANDAFLRIVGYDREDLAAGRLNRTMLTPPDWRDLDARNIAEMELIGTLAPVEKEYLRKDGSRVPVLIGAATFEEGANQGVGFVLDLTDRKRAEAEARSSESRYQEIQLELAHANRLDTMGLLTASIAHEINQPIAGVYTAARAALRWLANEPPAVEKARSSLERIARDADRAGNVIGRIRALVKKAPPRKESLNIGEAIREVVVLTNSEALKNQIAVKTHLAEGLPLIQGDRVQLQQVLLNLIVNAIQAMAADADGGRNVLITAAPAEPNGVLVALADSGPGLDPANLEHVFDAFYTTKPEGLGIGLSICRSIIDAHGGRLWVSANQPRGSVFQFTLPARAAEQS